MYNQKYSKKIVDKIIELKTNGTHTTSAICDSVRIHRDTLYDWLKVYPDFAAQWEKAKQAYLDNLGELSQSALALLLTKHEYEEVTTEYESDEKGQPRVKSVKKVKKFIMPNAGVSIFVATNRLPDVWKQKQAIEHTGKDGETLNMNPVVTIVHSPTPLARYEKDVDIDDDES